MLFRLILLCSLAFHMICACEINTVNNSQICAQFIEYIYKNFNTLSVDLVYNLPADKKLKVIITVRNIFKHMIEVDLIIKPKQFQEKNDIFKDAHYSKNLWIVLVNTIDMNEFLEDIEYRLNKNSQWVFLGTGEMTWIKSVQLSFNSQVYLAYFKSQSVNIKEAYSVNGKIQTRALMKWTQQTYNNNRQDQNDMIYLATSMYQRDMAGVIIKIIVFHDPPFVTINKNNSNNVTVQGFLIDLWNILEKDRRFKTETDYATSSTEGTLVKKVSDIQGYPTGLVKEALELHSDVILMLRQDSTNFSNIFDATTSILTLRLAIYQRIARPNIWLLITQIPSYAIPFIIFSFGIICGIFLRFYGQQTSDSLMIVVTIFVQQACTRLPSNIPSRIAILSILLLSTYVITVNLADITSLIINKPMPKQLTLHDMLDPARKVIIVEHSTIHNIMRENKTTLLGKILSRIELNHGFVKTIHDGLKRVAKDGVILLEMKDRVAYYFQEFDCFISQTITDFHTPTALLVNWTLPYREHLDYDLINMRENGLLSKLIKKWWPDRTRNCMDRFEIVRLQDCWQLFAIFIDGVILAVFVLTIETYYRNT